MVVVENTGTTDVEVATGLVNVTDIVVKSGGTFSLVLGRDADVKEKVGLIAVPLRVVPLDGGAGVGAVVLKGGSGMTLGGRDDTAVTGGLGDPDDTDGDSGRGPP